MAQNWETLKISSDSPAESELKLKTLRRHLKLAGVTYRKLADQLKKNKVWMAAVLHGIHPCSLIEAASILTRIPNLKPADQDELLQLLTTIPSRNLVNYEATDPFLYRLREVMAMYGPAIKSIVQEEIGDGIMSAIDVKIDCEPEKIKRDGTTRVKLVIDSKFLHYPTGALDYHVPVSPPPKLN